MANRGRHGKNTAMRRTYRLKEAARRRCAGGVAPGDGGDSGPTEKTGYNERNAKAVRKKHEKATEPYLDTKVLCDEATRQRGKGRAPV